MFEQDVPARRIGYLSPLPVIDNGPYEFYQLAPPGVMKVMIPVGLQEFSRADVERVFQAVDGYLELLKEREIDIVLQAGVPLPLLVGREYLHRLLAHIEARAGVPATSTVLCVVEAAKHLRLRRLALANKWSEAMNATLEEFFREGGIAVCGARTRPLQPKQFVRMSPLESLQLAYDLGRDALRAFPEADGLYIGGGAWLTLPIIARLEEEFGKPVITNQVATAWHLLHRLDCWRPVTGFGRLMSGD